MKRPAAASLKKDSVKKDSLKKDNPKNPAEFHQLEKVGGSQPEGENCCCLRGEQ